MVGDRRSRELYALKRVGFSSKATVKLVLPAEAARKSSALTVYLVSDCYLGLDQEIRITGVQDELPHAMQIASEGTGSGPSAHALQQREQRRRATTAAGGQQGAVMDDITRAHPTISCVAQSSEGAAGPGGDVLMMVNDLESEEEEFWDMAYSSGGR